MPSCLLPIRTDRQWARAIAWTDPLRDLEEQMDFEQAILAHRHWKDKLSDYLKKPDGSLSAMEVAKDDKCELGKWIHGDGAKHAKSPEFQHLRSEHARFHKAAADVVHKADSGANVSGETALGGHSEFAAASTAVVKAIMSLRSKLEKHDLVSK